MDQLPMVLHAEPEHRGIRAAVPAILLLTAVILYLIFFSFFQSLPEGGIGDYAIFLSCALSLPIGLGVAGVGEVWLKRRWHSGLSLTLSELGVKVVGHAEEIVFVDWTKRLSVLKWYFPLKGYPRGGRERRVQSSWLCLACQVQQDEVRFIVFTFMAPKNAARCTENGKYQELRPAEFYEGSRLRGLVAAPARPELPTQALAGKEGPYWIAERRRWAEGMELTADDFVTFVTELDQRAEA
jgi:hypothetical protein